MSTTNTFYATGKRKTSIARVYMQPGKGIIKVNSRELMIILAVKLYG